MKQDITIALIYRKLYKHLNLTSKLSTNPHFLLTVA